MKIIINESQFINLFEAATLSDIYEKYYSKIPKEEFNQIISADPTYNSENGNKMGKYGKWLLQLYINRNLKIEDLYKATTYLQFFIKYYNVIDDNDINHYRSLSDLYNVVSYYMHNDGVATSKSDEVRKIKEGAEKVYEDSEWLVVVPHTEEASCYYGKGTRWCTAAERSSNRFEQYNSQGPLYININKQSGAKYQFHFETDSFMNANNEEIDTPIKNEIGLSDGLVNWYKENVDDYEKLILTKYIFLYVGDTEYYAVPEIDGSSWSIVDNEGTKIATDLDKGNFNNISYYSNCLESDGWVGIPNIYGLSSLVVLDSGAISFFGGYSEISEVNGYDYEDINYILLKTVSSRGALNISYYPSNYDLYSSNDSAVDKVSVLNSNILLVSLENGLYDIVNIFNEETIEDLVDVELNEDNYGESLFITYRDGKSVEIDGETFNEISY